MQPTQTFIQKMTSFLTGFGMPTGTIVNGVFYLKPVTAPGTPSTGSALYVDSADNKLKAKGSSGTVTTLANP